MWLLVLVLQASPDEKNSRLPVRLALPADYMEIVSSKELADADFVRRFTTAPLGEIRLSAVLLPGPIAEGMTPPHVFLRPAQLPPDVRETTTTHRWQDLQIYAAEHVFEDASGRRFVATAVLPLKDRALLLRMSGPESRAPEARQDMIRLLDGTRGQAGWLTPAQKQHRKQSVWALVAAGLLAAAYFACWLVFFREQPLAAHVLRTAWLFVIGGALFVPVVLGVEILWMLPAIFTFSLAVRRIKLALEL